MKPNAVWLASIVQAGAVLTGIAAETQQRSVFVGLANFPNFASSQGATAGETVMVSPVIPAPNSWDELVVSWNAEAGTALKIEARAIYPDHTTRYYNLGDWSEDPKRHPRQSEKGQSDADGTVKTDTLVLTKHGADVQIRITFNGTNGATSLKFLGMSFCNNEATGMKSDTNKDARGKTLDVPERVQSGYEGPGGWCSPASLSMVLAYWSGRLHRADLDRPVPEVAAAVDDPVHGGTGNWVFNTAYAGSFPGMRAYVTRLDDIAELEHWVAAGVPVMLSVSSYLTNDRHDGPDNGHLVVCIGFTETGDMVANDPGVSLKNGQRVRRNYAREKVVEAWKKSKNTVYLIYPETWTVPRDVSRHWERVGTTK